MFLSIPPLAIYTALAILGVGILVLAAIEFIRVGRDIHFAKNLRQLSDPKGNSSNAMQLVAREIFKGSEAARTRLIRRLLVARAPAENARAGIWRTWHRMHIPAYVMQLARDTEREGVVLTSILDGLSQATSDKIAEFRAGAPSGSDGSLFDDLWPISECIEEMAIHTSRENHELFAKGVAAIALASQDETLHAQLGWIVNELLERTDAEALLGIRLAEALAKQSPFAREALQTLAEYKRFRERTKSPGTALDADEKAQKEVHHARAKQLVDVLARVDPITVAQDMKIAADAKGEREVLLEKLAASAAVAIKTKLATLRDASPVDLQAISSAIGGHCDAFIYDSSPLVGVAGIVRLASLRAVLAAMCEELTKIDPSQEKSSSTSAIAENVCRWVMRRGVSPGASRFIAIESMESIRDHRPVNAARAMVAFLAEDVRNLDPGIAVCICEGVEDSVGELSAAKLAECRFVHRNGEWDAMPSDTDVDDVRLFWREVGVRLGSGPIKEEDLPNWMNLRLDLRRARVT